MEVTHYFDLLKEGRQELIEYEKLIEESEKLRRKAKKNTLLLKRR